MYKKQRDTSGPVTNMQGKHVDIDTILANPTDRWEIKHGMNEEDIVGFNILIQADGTVRRIKVVRPNTRDTSSMTLDVAQAILGGEVKDMLVNKCFVDLADSEETLCLRMFVDDKAYKNKKRTVNIRATKIIEDYTTRKYLKPVLGDAILSYRDLLNE